MVGGGGHCRPGSGPNLLGLPFPYQEAPGPHGSSAWPGSACHLSRSWADCPHAAGAGTDGSAGTEGGCCRAAGAPGSSTGAWSPAESAGQRVPALGCTGGGPCGKKRAAGASEAAAALASAAS